MLVKNNYLYELLNGDLVYFEEKGKTVKKAGLEFVEITLRTNQAEKGAGIKSLYIIKDLLFSNERDLTMLQEESMMKEFYARMGKVVDELYSIMVRFFPDSKRVKENIREYIEKLDFPVSVPPELLGEQLTKNRLRRKILEANLASDPFLNALRVKYGYAITCHKAQGGEWQEVFIFLEGSLFYLEKEAQYRWAYTAISRSSKTLHFLDNMCLY